MTRDTMKLSDVPDLVEVPESELATFDYNPPEDTEPKEEEKDEKADYNNVRAKLVRRADWGASRPRAILALPMPVSKVAITYTETRACDTDDECLQAVRHMQSEHMAEGEDDIKFKGKCLFSFLLGGNGVIYEGRGFTRTGSKFPPSADELQHLNGNSINISFIGKHDTKPQKSAISALSSCLAEGATLDYLHPDFYTYYIVNNRIDYIQPPNDHKNTQPNEQGTAES